MNDEDDELVELSLEHDTKYRPPSHKKCLNCGNDFKTSGRQGKMDYCSSLCYYEKSRKFVISKSKLHEMVWSHPTTLVAKMLGVSDVTIYYRCKDLGVEKPPRGYWSKVKAGKT